MMFLNWLYPKKCVECGRQGKYFCESCLKTIEIDDRQGFDHLSIFKYKKLIRAAIQELKYKLIRDEEEELKELIVKGLKQKLADRTCWRFKAFLKQKPVIQPMPLHWKRKNWRGFNQAEVIAKLVAEAWGLEMIDSLERIKQTRVQSRLLRQERLKNIKQAFKARRTGLTKAVLVVDDVWTSGATMREAIKALKQAGAGEVWGLTLAR